MWFEINSDLKEKIFGNFLAFFFAKDPGSVRSTFKKVAAKTLRKQIKSRK
jgi:hypothetical protein